MGNIEGIRWDFDGIGPENQTIGRAHSLENNQRTNAQVTNKTNRKQKRNERNKMDNNNNSNNNNNNKNRREIE